METVTFKYPHSCLWPTKEQYLWLLRQEACHRGFLFNSKSIELSEQPFIWPHDDLDEDDRSIEQDLWLDEENDIHDDTPHKSRTPHRTDYSNIMESPARELLLRSYGWLYLAPIRKNLLRQLSERAVTASSDFCHISATLHDLGALWSSIASTRSKAVRTPLRLHIFSDVPQEATTIEYIEMTWNLSFQDFKNQIAAMGIVRHLTAKHHPEYAKNLFLDDSVVYHHPYPSTIDPADPSYPAEIHPTIRNYDDLHNGWYSHLVHANAEGMLNEDHDWRAIDTEIDWQSMLRCLRTSSAKAFMRHKSVDDRMNLVRRHRDGEELEVVRTGGHYLNLFLSRHMDMLDPASKHQIPLCPGQEMSGDEWKTRIVDECRRKGEVFEDEMELFRSL